MFSDRLLKLRKEKELSQLELAKDLNVAKQTVSNWENANRCPDYEMLVKIADYFDVSLDYLLGRTDNRDYSVVKTNYKGKEIELVINSKNNSYTQEQVQNLIDRLSEIYFDVGKLINKEDD